MQRGIFGLAMVCKMRKTQRQQTDYMPIKIGINNVSKHQSNYKYSRNHSDKTNQFSCLRKYCRC